ncbi:hypothetical protein AB2N08_17575 [Massilia aurea]|uniref:hypothetical protein n=1 Tax=Massilia aurea TaxID=373040 RepID=UPI0034617DC9
MQIRETSTAGKINGSGQEVRVALSMGEELGIGEVYASTGSDSMIERPTFRIIHKNHAQNMVWVIRLPVAGDGERHIRAPTSLACSDLAKLLIDKKIVKIQLTPPAVFLLSDAEIRARYSNKDGSCTIIDRRNNRYAILERLINSYSTGEILERGLVTLWVKQQAELTKRSRAKLYDDLHSYWAGNFSKNALIPDYWRSGAGGKERKQKTKLGRPNAKARADINANKGYFLSDDDKEKLSFGWRYFLSQGRTRSQAYLETMGVFYSERWEGQNGIQTPILLPSDLRPTPAQFERWGPAGDPRLTASRIQLGEIDWSKKYRGISGSAEDGMPAVGMQAVCDTTTNDAYLKSVTSRLKTVGPVNRLLITESRSNLIIGLHCGFDAPSAQTFLLAVAHGASSKVDFCARFGITISEDEWPACATRTYLGDNGEYRNELSRQALDQFGASVDNIPSGQPQFNGVAESKHHLLHARLDHQLDGTTYGQPRRRGKPHPAINACVNYFEYMRELIREILYHNNEEKVSHLLDAEMRRAQVVPTRISIYRWLIDRGYISDFVPDIAILRAHLYPSVPATLTESGVYLLREDQGARTERIPNARYMADCLVELGLLEQARRKGNRRITVRCNPIDPRSVWFQTERGLAELRNIHSDPILYNQATVADLVAMKDEDKIIELDTRGQDEQKRMVIVTNRQAMLSQAQAEKQGELKSLAKPMSKADHYSEIGKNRQDETAWLATHLSQSPSQETPSGSMPGIEHKKARSSSKLHVNATDPVQHVEFVDEPDDEIVNPALEALRRFMRGQNDQQ